MGSDDLEGFELKTDTVYSEKLDLSRKRKHVAKLKVSVESRDQSLGLDTDESYNLKISSPHSTLKVRICNKAKLHYCPT